MHVIQLLSSHKAQGFIDCTRFLHNRLYFPVINKWVVLYGTSELILCYKYQYLYDLLHNVLWYDIHDNAKFGLHTFTTDNPSRK